MFWSAVMHEPKGGQDAGGHRPDNANLHDDDKPHSREAQATRERLTEYLAGMDADETALAVEGLRYLRGPGRVARRRMAREAT